ncbi:MAG: VWA domain-containing protein [Catenulispora sp.]|nr:VWA domain-containing protein [Catenulispora sp.]NUT39994.1 VWA domain-containing protein [Thermoactinospora sp.]
MGKATNALKELARRAGRWLGLADTAPTLAHTTAIVADRFDAMSWRDTLDQATALQELAEELAERHDHTTDLLADVFLAAYKADPQIRPQSDMDPARLVNHQVITSLLGSPEFAELRRETAGDPYAAAMAVLAQADGLRRMLDHARDAHTQAQQAAEARQRAAEAAQAVAAALDAAAAAEHDGIIPDEHAQAVTDAIAAAEHAGQEAATAAAQAIQAITAAAPGLRVAARQAATHAAKQAQEEAALMAAWGIGPGQLQRMDFDQRAQLAQRLRSGRLGRFADLIGRFRQMASGERARRVENAPGELVGVTLGDDLSRLVPGETANLGTAALRPVFAARYAEARLMLYDSRGEQHTGQGAIIAVVDCSGSMATPQAEGITGEAWAKACTLALLDQARAARRDFTAILFSDAGEQAAFTFPAGTPAPIGDVVKLAETFYGGGTDFAAPLSAAAELLAEQYNLDGHARGDIVLITDGECGVTEDWMRAWNDSKHQLGFRTFGIAIGSPAATAPGGVLDALCDNLRDITDLTDTHAAADLFRLI